MECLIGLQFEDFVIVAADMTNAHSIVVMKDDENKLHKISNNIVMAVAGETGDTTQFSEYISKNIQLYKMRNGYELSPKAAATFTRRNLADALRSRNQYHVNLLIAGHDDKTGPELYYMDYLAALVRVPYYAFGYGGFFVNAILDCHHRSTMTQDEAYQLLKLCVKEVQKRLLLNLPNFKVQLINKNGITDLPTITSKMLAREDQSPQ